MSDTRSLPAHDRAIIISSGDEILTGQLLDTNAQFFARSLVDLGVLPLAFFSIPDDREVIADTLRRACEMASLVIISGGLGPTEGDLTRLALSDVLGDELIIDESAKTAIETILMKRGRSVTERQLRQAYRPRSAVCLANAFGTAPGLRAVVRNGNGITDVFCLPGPPGELRPMWRDAVVLQVRVNAGRVVLTRLLHVVGVAEAEAVQRLGVLTKRTMMPLVGITASGGVLTLRIRYEGSGEGSKMEAERSVSEAEARAREALGDHVFAVGDAAVGTGIDFLARTVLSELERKKRSLSVVESCTGGMLGEMLTSIPGSSSSFNGGGITYSNELKARLGVKQETLERYGAVSREVVSEMGIAGVREFGTQHALAISGVAGPGGGSADKPVGAVHIAHAYTDASGTTRVDARRFLFSGDREDVRKRACVSALAMLYFHLRGRADGEPVLLWQTDAQRS